MAKPRSSRGSLPVRKLDNLIKIIGLLLALGAPVVSLISMMSSYKDRQEELTAKVGNIVQIMSKISDNSNSDNASLEGFKQTIINNQAAILRLQQSQDVLNEKILELWKQTSANNARLDEMQTEIVLIRNQKGR